METKHENRRTTTGELTAEAYALQTALSNRGAGLQLTQQPQHQRLLSVQAILGLVEHHRVGRVEHRLADELFATQSERADSP